MASLLRSLTALVLVIPSAVALQVTPGSSCASVCLDRAGGDAKDPKASNTRASDIVCNDVDYWSTDVGEKFRSCTQCLQNSTKVETTENDAAWYLYNLRYALDVCLFTSNSTQPQKGSSSPCSLDQTCGSLRTALEAGALNPANATEYQYCTADSGAFSGQAVSNCAQCFQATTGQKYLSNFIAALNIGCLQQPAPGSLLGIDGSLFSTTPITMTAAANATAPAAQSSSSSSTMTTGTIVGIVVGAGLLFLGGIALLIVYWRRQRRYSREDDNPSRYSNKPSPSYTSTITSNHLPSYTTDYKGGLPAYEAHANAHAHAQAHAQGEYESNADYYDRMVGIMGPQRPSDLHPESVPRDLSALPTHHAYVPRAASRTSRSESPNLGNATQPRASATDAQAQAQAQAQAAPARESIRIPPPPPRPQLSIALSTYPSQRPAAEQGPRESALPAAPGPSVIIPPPPPPPQARVKAASLILPSVTRIRAPKKYTPPQIAIQDATPIEQPDPNISLPFSMREERFKRDGGEEGYIDRFDRADRGKSRMLRVDKKALRDGDTNYQELPIGSGKSILYGI